MTEFGLGDLGATMAARLLHFGTDNFLINTGTHPNGVDYAHVPTDTSLPITINRTFYFPGHPHFPYGREVEDDGPV